jgi:hypothetical protein
MHHFVSRLILHIIGKYIGISLLFLYLENSVERAIRFKMIMIDTIMMKNAQALLGKLHFLFEYHLKIGRLNEMVAPSS